MAHIYAPPGYSWISDTVSRLADPGHPHGWMFRTGMIVYGIILILSTPDLSLPSVLIIIYGIGVICTGIFHVERYERIHMFSIYIAGASLIILMFRFAITGDITSIVCLFSMIAAELLFNIRALGKWRGLNQRAVHISMLIWLLSYGFSN